MSQNMTLYSKSVGVTVFSLPVRDGLSPGLIGSTLVVPPGYSRLDLDTYNVFAQAYPRELGIIEDESETSDRKILTNSEKRRMNMTSNFLDPAWCAEFQLTEAQARTIWNADIELGWGIRADVLYFRVSDGGIGHTILHAVPMQKEGIRQRVYLGIGGTLIGEMILGDNVRINWLKDTKTWYGLCKVNAIPIEIKA